MPGELPRAIEVITVRVAEVEKAGPSFAMVAQLYDGAPHLQGIGDPVKCLFPGPPGGAEDGDSPPGEVMAPDELRQCQKNLKIN
jgi:hypothetical protein